MKSFDQWKATYIHHLTSCTSNLVAYHYHWIGIMKKAKWDTYLFLLFLKIHLKKHLVLFRIEVRTNQIWTQNNFIGPLLALSFESQYGRNVCRGKKQSVSRCISDHFYSIALLYLVWESMVLFPRFPLRESIQNSTCIPHTHLLPLSVSSHQLKTYSTKLCEVSTQRLSMWPGGGDRKQSGGPRYRSQLAIPEPNNNLCLFFLPRTWSKPWLNHDLTHQFFSDIF